MGQNIQSDIIVPADASRRSFLRRSTAIAVAGGSAAILAGSGTNAAFGASQSSKNAAQTNESRYFRMIQKHENYHVEQLVAALGAAARPKPTFQNLTMSSFSSFMATSQALENTGVGAYLGAAPVIDNPDYLAAAASIMAIEARHAGYLNVVNGSPITGNALELLTDHGFEMPLTIAQVVAAAGPFIANLNGGPALTFTDVPSPQNDIDILNFALALEYLEAEFYNLNANLYDGMVQAS